MFTDLVTYCYSFLFFVLVIGYFRYLPMTISAGLSGVALSASWDLAGMALLVRRSQVASAGLEKKAEV